MSMSRSGMICITALALGACGRGAKLSQDDEKPSPTRTANTATSEDWKGQNPANAEELFAGRFPGVTVYRVSGGIKVQIRGASSVNSGTEPLYVIDGMTIEPGPGGALVGLNPADIAKIEVLKDIGSTSMYGVRGGNGVILITTKRGN
jgi:TonB-dependent SusC/RagA subfamily outer membrane receptor